MKKRSLALIAALPTAACIGFVVQAGSTVSPTSAEIARMQLLAGQGDDVDAMRALRRAAAGGVPEAQLALGQVLIASGSPGEVQEGMASLQSATAQGEERARLLAAKVYLKGAAGLAPDPAVARRLFEEGLGQGDRGAAYYLGLMHKNGIGTRRDSAQAARLLQFAATKGVPAAMFILANMYLDGDGMAADSAQARMWLQRAAEMGHPEAELQIAMGMKDGTMGFEKNDALLSAQLMEAAHSLKHRPSEP